MVWGRIARELPPSAFKLEFPFWNPQRATPIEPPFGVGPTEEVFGPLGPGGVALPSRRIELPFVQQPPQRLLYEEPGAPVRRAERVPPGYAENYELLRRLGVPPIEPVRVSPYVDAKVPRPYVHTGRRTVTGFDEYDQPIIADTRRRRDAAPWLRSTRQQIMDLERLLKRETVGLDSSGNPIYKKAYDRSPYYEQTLGPDGQPIFRRRVGRDIDETFVTRTRWDSTQGSMVEESVPLRRIYEERHQALRSGTPSWWAERETLDVSDFEKKLNFIGLRDAGTGERIGIEMLDSSGKNKIVVPTGRLDASDPDQVFVFGSNLEGVHGAGAALEASKTWGAQRGVGKGLTGRAYAFPTKRTPSKTQRQFEVFEIENYFDELFETASLNPTKKFMVTPVGTGLAGYELQEVADIIARAAAKGVLPSNVVFTDVTEEGAERFAAAIARARNRIPEEFVTIDPDALEELEKAYGFSDGGIRTRAKREQDLELPALPAASILQYADPSYGASPGTLSLSSIIDDVLRSGNDEAIAIIQAFSYRRIQSASTPRAIVSALRDFRKVEPTLKKNSLMRIGIRDAIENRMERLGALNKQAAADTYVYLAEEVVDSKKLASYIDAYIEKAESFDELLGARFWLDDVFVSSKLSHPELIARNEWSKLESRLVENIDKRIETLRLRAKKYNKQQGTQLISYNASMSPEALRKMLSEAIGTARSLDELRVINGMINKIGVSGEMYEDLKVMIRSVRPIVAARSKRPVRSKDLRRTRIKELSSFIDSPRDPKAPELSARRAGAAMTGEEPRYSDIVGWEEGSIAARYEPYNPESMQFGATAQQKKWITEESIDFVDRLRSTLDYGELSAMRLMATNMKEKGMLSGRMWKFLSKELEQRQQVIFFRRKRLGLYDEAFQAEQKVDASSPIAWAQSQSLSRRGATRFWNDPDVAARDDLSDFVQGNPLYDELIHDAQMLDAASGRNARGMSGNEMLDNPFLDFDDGLGEISIARGDIAEEIIQNTNRRFWEIDKQISSLEKTLEGDVDYLGRSLDNDTITIKGPAGKEDVTITYRQYYLNRLNELVKESKRIQVDDQAWYDGMGESNLPFGTRRIVSNTDPNESRLEVFDWETEEWIPADHYDVLQRKQGNAAIRDKNLSEALTVEPDSSVKVYESALRRYVDQNGKESTVRPLVRMYVPDAPGYAYRTYINASGSDATIAVAADFDSGGEKLTKRFAYGGVLRYDHASDRYVGTYGSGVRTRYIDVPHASEDIEKHVSRIIDQLNEAYRKKNDTPITVNFAGNALKSLRGDQKGADEFAYRLMRAVMEHPRRRFVIANTRSGGQGGYDEAFMKAMIRLEIPMDITLPRAKYGEKIMVQAPDGSTEYLSVKQYLERVGFARDPIPAKFPSERTPPLSSTNPARELAPTIEGATMKMPMNFKDGERGLRMSPANKGKSTMDLILEGTRTGTTRSSLAQFNKADGSPLQVGDVVEFTDRSGRTARVEITKAPYQLPQATDAIRRRWSELEGRDPAMYDGYAGQWQIQYKLLGS